MFSSPHPLRSIKALTGAFVLFDVSCSFDLSVCLLVYLMRVFHLHRWGMRLGVVVVVVCRYA